MTEFDRFAALSFDCYGTLIDWETGIVEALRPWTSRHGIDDEPTPLGVRRPRDRRRVRAPGDALPRRPRRDLQRVAGELGVDVTGEEQRAFGASVPNWPAFPDSTDALAQLHERFRLIILSNIDRTSFAASARRLGIEFDARDHRRGRRLVQAEPGKLRRPARRHRRHRELLHVAQSLYHDHEPAKAAGLPTVWIDRRHDRTGTGATPTAGPWRPTGASRRWPRSPKPPPPESYPGDMSTSATRDDWLAAVAKALKSRPGRRARPAPLDDVRRHHHRAAVHGGRTRRSRAAVVRGAAPSAAGTSASSSTPQPARAAPSTNSSAGRPRSSSTSPASPTITADGVERRLDGVLLDLAPVVLHAGTRWPRGRRRTFDAAGRHRGGLGADPIGDGSRAPVGRRSRRAPRPPLAGWLGARRPSLRVVTVDGTRYHDAGASDAQQLGSTIAAARRLPPRARRARRRSRRRRSHRSSCASPRPPTSSPRSPSSAPSAGCGPASARSSARRAAAPPGARRHVDGDDDRATTRG